MGSTFKVLKGLLNAILGTFGGHFGFLGPFGSIKVIGSHLGPVVRNVGDE